MKGIKDKLQRVYSKNKNEAFPDNRLTYKRQSAMLLHYNPMFTENKTWMFTIRIVFISAFILKLKKIYTLQ